MSSLGKRKRSRGHENSLLHSVSTVRTGCHGQEPPERKPKAGKQHGGLATPLRYGSTYYVLITRNALKNFCILKHALERATRLAARHGQDVLPLPKTPPPLAPHLKQKTRHAKSSRELATLGRTGRRVRQPTATVLQHFKNAFRFFFSLIVFNIVSFYFLCCWEIRNNSNIWAEESHTKCLDKLSPKKEMDGKPAT